MQWSLGRERVGAQHDVVAVSNKAMLRERGSGARC